VVFTQVCAGFGDDERTRGSDRPAAHGGHRLNVRGVLRISVRNGPADADDVTTSAGAAWRAASAA
jgi:hypothetical protein